MLLAALFAVDFPHEVAVPLHGVIMLITYATALLGYFRHVSRRAFFQFIIGSLPGFALGALIIGHVDRHFAQIAISIIILYATWAPKSFQIKNPLVSTDANMVAAGVIGSVSSIAIGAASTFISPLYLRKEWDTKTLMGTKMACVAFLQVGKIGIFSFFGFNIQDHISLLIPMSICVIIGNIIGVYWVGRISSENYRVLYRSVLTVAVIGLFVDVIVDHLSGNK